ncbi:MAG: TIGR03943 family protein [Chloroflexaceae bacterium]|jgi:uncharacterized repeat protein (TIGR03943 family)|nr:TIGR03943 family protein [Chloroflexaceae bacterium]
MAISQTSQSARPLNWLALAEVVLLGGTAVLFLSKWARGLLDFYIHPRYNLLVVVCSAVLLLMAAARTRAIFTNRPTRQPGWIYMLMAMPLLVGVLVPARPLGADTLASRGLETQAVVQTSNWQPRNTDPATWNLLEWTTALSVRGDSLQGSPIDVIGFVFHGQQAETDTFFVTRYVITCCAADGAGVGLPVRWANGQALPANNWVRVRGTVNMVEVGDKSQPAIMATTVEPVPQPDNPYLYP